MAFPFTPRERGLQFRGSSASAAPTASSAATAPAGTSDADVPRRNGDSGYGDVPGASAAATSATTACAGTRINFGLTKFTGAAVVRLRLFLRQRFKQGYRGSGFRFLLARTFAFGLSEPRYRNSNCEVRGVMSAALTDHLIIRIGQSF